MVSFQIQLFNNNKSACFYVLRYLEIQKYVDIEMETIIMSFISLLFEQIHIVIHFLMFHDKL